jgi:hypothetical protein
MNTRKGKIIFDASITSFEDIKAVNNNVSCVLITKTGEIKCVALIKNFHFKLSLLEEHFNTNYMESDNYPKATLNGFIQGFNINIIGSVPKKFDLRGKLEIRGRTKEIHTDIFLRKMDDRLEIVSEFTINTDDFDIEIPTIISSKISKTVTLQTEFVVK